jgi:probable HAF family extracellular repeat protein
MRALYDFLALLAGAAALPAGASAQVIYTVTDLGTLGGNFVEGYSVNSAGQVAGRSTLSDNTTVHAFRSAANGQPPGLSDLGTLGGSFSYAWGINASGQVTGYSPTAGDLQIHAFRTTATGRVSDPGADLGGGVAFAINASGQVTGNATVPGPPVGVFHAFRSTANGQPVSLMDLGVFAGGTNSSGMAINDAGQVAGYSAYGPPTASDPTGPVRAFRTTPAGLISDPGADLGTLGGSESRAVGINSTGQVVGSAFTTFDVANHAFRSSPNGQPVSLTDLGTLGGSNSSALAINSFGVVVGESEIVPGVFVQHAFIYDTQMRDLNSLIAPGSGWTLGGANGINDLGQITGVGSFGGQSHAFLLTPVPEPSALVLAGLAAGAWLWRRRLDRTRSPSRIPLG